MGALRFSLALALASSACSRPSGEATHMTKQLPATVIPSALGLAPSWDWNGIIGTGQSLGVGVAGTPLRNIAASYRNLKLDLGGRWLPASDEASSRISLVPLREPIRPLAWGYPGPYPRNIYGETPHSAMASQITALLLSRSSGAGDYVTVHTVVGESGQDMRTIAATEPASEETGHAYSASLFEARAITRLARAQHRSFGIGAILLTHGEANAVDPSYEQALFELWQSYNRDLPPITGQSRPIPLLVTQQSSCPLDPGSVAMSALAVQRACAAHPGQLVCAGPRYQYSYAADAVHLDALGYDRLGEKYGQVYFESVARGRPFRPLEPRAIARDGQLIRVELHVPVPPLRWEEQFPPPHQHSPEWSLGRGFEVSAGSARVAIASVDLDGSSVTIRLREPPQGKLVLRYAASASPTARPGGTYRWGQLRDSDPFVGATSGTPQPNYAVSFELPVP